MTFHKLWRSILSFNSHILFRRIPFSLQKRYCVNHPAYDDIFDIFFQYQLLALPSDCAKFLPVCGIQPVHNVEAQAVPQQSRAGETLQAVEQRGTG